MSSFKQKAKDHPGQTKLLEATTISTLGYLYGGPIGALTGFGIGLITDSIPEFNPQDASVALLIGGFLGGAPGALIGFSSGVLGEDATIGAAIGGIIGGVPGAIIGELACHFRQYSMLGATAGGLIGGTKGAYIGMNLGVLFNSAHMYADDVYNYLLGESNTTYVDQA